MIRSPEVEVFVDVPNHPLPDTTGAGLGVLIATLVGLAVGVAVAGTVVAVDVC